MVDRKITQAYNVAHKKKVNSVYVSYELFELVIENWYTNLYIQAKNHPRQTLKNKVFAL